MGYTGRITGAGFIMILVVIIRIWAYYYLNYPITLPPIFGIICAIIAWYLGKQYDQARYYSERDPLTGLYNRRFVYQVFPLLFAQMDRYNAKLCIAILDCDNYKSINDTYGHEKGDLVLQHISNILSTRLRKSDIAVRWGGDEFLIVAPFANREDFEVVIKQLQHELRELYEMLHVEISISAGIAVYPDDTRNLEDLIIIADSAMYKFKESKLLRTLMS